MESEPLLDFDAFGSFIPDNLTRRAPSVREVAGRLVIDWPDPRPRSFQITAEVFEALIARANGDK